MTRSTLRLGQLAVAAVGVLLWHGLTTPGLLPALGFDDPQQASRWVGRPLVVLQQLADWFASGAIVADLASTLSATGIGVAIGLPAGCAAGLWLASSPRLAAVLAPISASPPAMRWLVAAPLFGLWFGSGAGAKTALATALVFLVVFREVRRAIVGLPPAVLANARLLGASRSQLLRHVHLPNALGAVGAVLRRAVGLAFVAAVLGEYLGAATGLGFVVLQAVASANASEAIAAVLVAGACLLLLDAVAGAVGRHLVRWPVAIG